MGDCNIQIYSEIGQGRPSPLFNPTVVYKARIKNTVDFVAAKAVDSTRIEEVTNAVRLFHTLDHQNIVTFNNWFQSENRIYIVIEYCPGGSLFELLERDVRLPESIIRIFGSDILCGLLHLHNNQIIYGNFDSHNFFIDENGIIKLGDFNRSIQFGENLNLTDIDIEFLEVLAPELFEGKGASMASDIYSFGCILYKMAYGETPFASAEQEEVVYKLRNTNPERLPYCSAEFNDLVFKMLDKDPNRRINWKDLIDHEFWRDVLTTREDADEIVPPKIESNVRKSVRDSISSIRDSRDISSAFSTARDFETDDNESEFEIDSSECDNNAESLTMSIRQSTISALSTSLGATVPAGELLRSHPLIKEAPLAFNAAIESFRLAKYNVNAMPVTIDDIKEGEWQPLIDAFAAKDKVKRLSPLITFAINAAKIPECATSMCNARFICAVLNLANKTGHPSIATTHCLMVATIIQNSTKVTQEAIVECELLQKMCEEKREKIRKKAICAACCVAVACAKYNLDCPDFIMRNLPNWLKDSDDVIRHYSIRAAANCILFDSPIDFSKVDLTCVAASNSASMTESLAVFACLLYKNRSSDGFVVPFCKTLICKVGSTAAGLGICLAATCDVLPAVKDELINNFAKVNGELRARYLMAVIIALRGNTAEFIQISERFFGLVDRLQYDFPLNYEEIIRAVDDSCDRILEECKITQNYAGMQVVVDGMQFQQSCLKIYRPRFDRRIREVIKECTFEEPKSELLIEAVIGALTRQICDPSVCCLMARALASNRKEVKFAALKSCVLCTNRAVTTDAVVSYVTAHVVVRIEGLLQEEGVIAETALKATANCLAFDTGCLELLDDPVVVSLVFQQIPTSSAALDIAVELMRGVLGADAVVQARLVPGVMAGMDRKDSQAAGVSLLLLTLQKIQKRLGELKGASQRKLVKDVGGLSTMAAKCASLVLEYPEAAECLKILIEIFTPAPGQTDVVVESAFKPFAISLEEGHKNPLPSRSLTIVVEQLERSAVACQSMRLKLKGSAKLMSAMRKAAENGTDELRRTTDSALRTIRK